MLEEQEQEQEDDDDETETETEAHDDDMEYEQHGEQELLPPATDVFVVYVSLLVV